MKDCFEKRGPRPRLEAEADGLRAIAATGCIRVPQVFGIEDRPQGPVLLLERLELATPDADFGARLAHDLAALHAHPSPLGGDFGWTCDNFIGATPQLNPRNADWISFWRDARLAPLRARLCGQPVLDAAVGQVMATMQRLFTDGHVPQPSLIHGDLWSGNWGMLPDGTPVVFDPCVSCSDAEAELAMMALFGSAPAGFLPAYVLRRGFAPGHEARKHLYQLYHLLNHVTLFGAAYVRAALASAAACLRAARTI